MESGKAARMAHSTSRTRNFLIITGSGDSLLSHRDFLIKRLLGLSFKVWIICPVGSAYKISRQYPEINFIYLPLNRGEFSLKKLIHSLLILKTLFLQNHFDEILVLSVNFSIFFIIFRRFIRRNITEVRFLFTGLGKIFTSVPSASVSSLSARFLARMVSYLIRIGINSSDLVLVQNRDDRQVLVKILGRPVTDVGGVGVTLQKGVRARAYRRDGRLQICFFSRLLRDKGINDFLEVSTHLKLEYQGKVDVWIAGKGDIKNPSSLTSEQISELTSVDLLNYIGHVDEPKKFLTKMDVLVFPSYREGFPLALMEAAACGCILVAYDVPGSRDCVVHGWNGFLVEKLDRKAMFVTLANILNMSDEKLYRLGQNSVDLAENRWRREQHVDMILNE